MGQLITANQAVDAAQKWLDREESRRAFEVALGSAYSPDEAYSQIYALLRSDSKFREVLVKDPAQLMGAFLEVARLGLSLSKHMGHVAILPFANKRRQGYDLVVSVMYRGWITMGHREACVESITAQPVFLSDDFDYSLGTDAYVRHRKCTVEPKDYWAELRGAYCIGTMTPSAAHVTPVERIEWLEKWEIEAIRKKSRGANHADSPWKTDPHRMSAAKAIHRWYKQAPTGLRSKSVTVSPIDRAISLAEADDADETQHLENNVPAEVSGEGMSEDEMRSLADELKGEFNPRVEHEEEES